MKIKVDEEIADYIASIRAKTPRAQNIQLEVGSELHLRRNVWFLGGTWQIVFPGIEVQDLEFLNWLKKNRPEDLL